jgi:long-chain acyl-CoA synthetase
MLLPQSPHVQAIQLAPRARNIPDMLRLRARRNGNQPALYTRSGGLWEALSWEGFLHRATQAARGLLGLGLRRGERVAINGPTQAPWTIYDQAAQIAGLVPLGIYPQQTVEQIRYVLAHSGARAVLVGDADELLRVLAACRELAPEVTVIPWTAELYAQARDRHPEARLGHPELLQGAALSPTELEELLAAIAVQDTALLVYTSGTTGPPKGAMLSHANVLTFFSSDVTVQKLYEDDIAMSFLPMAHVAERVLSSYGRISAGVAAAFATSMGAVLTEIREVAPTMFGSVPRIFEKAYSKIHSEIERKPKAVQRLFAWAKHIGGQRAEYLLSERPVPTALQLQYALAQKLVFRRIHAVFGGRIRQFIVGAAPTQRAVLEFFWAAGLPIYETYGMTEATVVTHINRPGAVRLGTVGRLLPPMEQKLAPDGEVLLRGPWVFQGYYKNEAATREILQDGWLHTGDIGTLDSDGYLRITDRKKHLIITAGGKNLSPGNIEAAVKSQEALISQVVPHGDGRPYVSALIAPSPLETLEWGVQHGVLSQAELAARTQELIANPAARSEALNRAMAQVVGHPQFQERFVAAVRRANLQLAHVEQVRRFVLLSRDLSQEHGELTPSMKVKRKEVERLHAAALDKLYASENFGLSV